MSSVYVTSPGWKKRKTSGRTFQDQKQETNNEIARAATKKGQIRKEEKMREKSRNNNNNQKQQKATKQLTKKKQTLETSKRETRNKKGDNICLLVFQETK